MIALKRLQHSALALYANRLNIVLTPDPSKLVELVLLDFCPHPLPWHEARLCEKIVT